MARTFDANTANYLSVGDAAAIDITGLPITVAAWVKTNSVSTEQGIVTKWGSTGATQQYELELSATGKVSFGVVTAGPSSTLVTGATTVTNGAWQHVAGRQTATDVFVYLNGAQDGTNTNQRSIQNTTASLLIGKFTAGVAFNGLIAEVAIWNLDLTAAEIALLAAGYPASMIQAANLKGYWKLQGTASPEPDDASANNATINGTVVAGNGPPIKTGGAVAGAIAAGSTASAYTKVGFATVGTVASGVKVFVGAVTYLKTGFAVVAMVGTGVESVTPVGSIKIKAGYGLLGLTMTSRSHKTIQPKGVSFGFGQSVLTDYPDWTRVDAGAN